MGNALRFIGVLAIFVAAVSGVVWSSSARERELADREFAELNAAHAMLSSAVLDLPTGATVVCAFGLSLLGLGFAIGARGRMWA